ncbi:MAG: tetratricopeptide repeat protein [Treponema sp.]|jgi:tetratricopeptide (TPR) repeat protein|nr:tetratricopeptide repeat protein [Treponema sp.]
MKKKFFVLAGVLIVAGLFAGCASTGMSAEAYYNRGRNASGKKDWNEAIAEYTRAINEYPDYKEAYYYRGRAYLYEGDFAQAEKDFLEVLRIDPSDNDAKVSLRDASAPHAAFLLCDEGVDAVIDEKYDLAVEKNNQAIALFPSYAKAYNNRGVAYFRMEMYDEARADYEKAVELDPEYATGYANLSDIYKNRGEYDKAEQYLNRALVIDPAYTYAKRKLEEVVAMNAEKDAWDRRIAANPNPYPAPFNGQWKYVTPPRQVTGKTVTYREYETKYEQVMKGNQDQIEWGLDGRGRRYAARVIRVPNYVYEQVTREVTKTRTIPAFMMPELSTIWEFDGSTYRKTEMLFVDDNEVLAKATLEGKKPLTPSEANRTIKRATKTGTFYYNGAQIELEDGTILRFVNGAINDGAGNRYTKQ